ncbi:aspartate kinase [Limosilactobacillus sp. STM2_1]|uniref:Aspartokinase n=1 Tax=Limosilactobacillus rudii TaxID=2759755 RepID=A0A7W3YM86_9LACO|nr:aspartate kinase [Limosilactobacillus rudii]MBB1078559.1 aspartate kinase [Limosilactobacillus rudii]MBB1097199.1 aspartate kinase [Limosilactobacillus rudii]MCD7133885.1 aspartate kinase [Limosilactobacillus rudii]
MKVVKFGGSSLANGEAFQNAINIITADSDRRVIVTSAPGKRFADDIKVTDLLITYANTVINDKDPHAIIEQIISRYQEIADYFALPAEKLAPLVERLQSLPDHPYPNNNYLMAAFKAHGERLNAQLMAIILRHLGYEARFVTPREAGITVTGTPNNASVIPETYAALSHFSFNDTELLIFPGFYGITLAGHIATFSRGGSDITGAILARGFNASVYENFTDVDAIYSANPNVVDHPQPIAKMTYREMRELSYAGFSVFHDEALIPAIQGNIPINVRNTNDPEKPGTLIVPDKDFQASDIVTGVVSGKHFAALYLHKYLLNKQAGFTLRILEILAKHDISYEHMPSGIDDITIILDRNSIDDQLVDVICNEIQEEINPDRLEWIDNYAITMVVGEGMRDRTGVIDDILMPLAQKNIAVPMINQGASRIAIMIGTYDKDADEAVRAIYHRFFVN